MSLLGDRGVGSWSPVDIERHVYSDWDPILAKRGSYHPALDAFRRPENRASQVRYSKDMCPRTLDLLSRAAVIDLHPDSRAAAVRRKIEACRRAAEELANQR